MEINGQTHYYDRLRDYIFQLSGDRKYDTHHLKSTNNVLFNSSNISCSNGEFKKSLINF